MVVDNRNGNEFSNATITALAKRAAHRCSNPGCGCPTGYPSESDPSKFVNTGQAAHISGAAPGSARYDPNLVPEQRRSIENGIHLCDNCARMIDMDVMSYPSTLLLQWKVNHEQQVREAYERRGQEEQLFTELYGAIVAEGEENVTGAEVLGAARFYPGSRVTARGSKNVTGMRIGGKQ